MKTMLTSKTMTSVAFSALATIALLAVGCGKAANETGSGESAVTSTSDGEQAGHNHMGWWCTEHGVPEEECSICSSSAAARFKEKGDWCEEHNRAESQCFLCDPSRADKFAKLYEAKFGQAPPSPSE